MLGDLLSDNDIAAELSDQDRQAVEGRYRSKDIDKGVRSELGQRDEVQVQAKLPSLKSPPPPPPQPTDNGSGESGWPLLLVLGGGAGLALLLASRRNR